MNFRIITQILIFVALGLADAFQPTELTVQIQVGDLLGSATVILYNLSTNCSVSEQKSHSITSNSTTSCGPHKTGGYPVALSTGLYPSTTVPPRFANSTANTNVSAGMSVTLPFASPTPTATSINLFSSGALSKQDYTSVIMLSSLVLFQLSLKYLL